MGGYYHLYIYIYIKGYTISTFTQPWHNGGYWVAKAAGGFIGLVENYVDGTTSISTSFSFHTGFRILAGWMDGP